MSKRAPYHGAGSLIKTRSTAVIRPVSAFAVANASLSTNRIPESALHRAAPASFRCEHALAVRDLPPPSKGLRSPLAIPGFAVSTGAAS
jgi:hypothetical protein